MKLVPQGRPTTTEEGRAFIEQYIFPTPERCKKLQDDDKILAGGQTSGAIGLALIVNACCLDNKRLDNQLARVGHAWKPGENSVSHSY